MMVKVCGEVYHKHPDELKPGQRAYLLEFVAAKITEHRILKSDKKEED